MAKRPEQMTPTHDDVGPDLTPRELTRQEFGRRLMQLMLAKGWNQSELSRRAGIGRDAVSTYIRGVSFPESLSLNKLAKALSMEPGELLPNTVVRAMESDVAPMLEIRQAAGHPDKCWLRVNQMVDFDVAAEILQMLRASKAKPA